MINLKLVAHGSYRKKGTGNWVFRYLVRGTEDAVEAYKEHQDNNLVMDEELDEPLYFTRDYHGETAKLVISETSMYVDNSEMQKRASLVKSMGGDLGTALAQEIARSIVGGKTHDPMISSQKRNKIKKESSKSIIKPNRDALDEG